LIVRIISDSLAQEGLPMQIDPFSQPQRFTENAVPRLTDKRREQDEILERIMSGDEPEIRSEK